MKINKTLDITHRPLDGFCLEVDGDYMADNNTHQWISSFEYIDNSDNGWLKQWLEAENKKIEPNTKYSIIVLKEK